MTENSDDQAKGLNDSQMAKWRSIRSLLERKDMAAAYRAAVALNAELIEAGVQAFPSLYKELVSALALWKVADREASV